MSAANKQWTRRSKGNPCPYCDHTDERCMVSNDGMVAICYKVGQDGATERTGQDGSVYWVYNLNGHVGSNGHVSNGKPPEDPECAVPDTLHRVYSAFLGLLSLSVPHRDAMAQRGFPEDEIGRLQYRTLPGRNRQRTIAEMEKKFGVSLAHIPGFYFDPQLKLAALPGMLIPARDNQGRIVGLMVRPDKKLDNGNKYLWISSVNHNGPSPGAPVHVPLGITGPVEVLRVTEGIFKADLSTILSGIPTISAPGVTSWAGCIPVARDLDAEEIRLAFDADWQGNPKVARALHNCAQAIIAAGFPLKIETWNIDDGKGIDDLLAAGKTPEVLTTAETATVLKEAARIAGIPSGTESAPSLDKSLAKRPRTDLGNGERLVARHGRDFHYCHPWNKFLAWDSMRWAIDNTAAIRRKAKATVRAILSEAGTIQDDEQRKAHVAWWVASEANGRVKAMLESAAAEQDVPILPDEMDRDPWSFNCRNGTIDLRTGELRPHRREDLITKLCPLEYNPDAPCPLWEKTLRLFFADRAKLIDYWQRICGYSLVGVIRDHIMPIAYGTGSNGKSTILGALLDAFGPDYAMKCPPDMLMAKKTDSHPTDRADLFGKRLVVAIETESGRRLNETMVKELTGGDRVRARRMREDFWEYTPSHTLIMATNHKPQIKGTDRGIWRRLKLVPFTVAVDGDQADKAMPERLRTELPGILAWCVRGCLTWQEKGLNEPEDVSKATAGYRKEQDLIGAFLDEWTVSVHSARVKAGALYARYRQWAEAGGETVLSQTLFGAAIEERGIEKRRSGGIWYLGIGLRQDDEQPDFGPARENDPREEGEV